MSIAAIDPTKPVDGVPAVKADLRANLAAIKGALESFSATGVPPGSITETQLAPAIVQKLGDWRLHAVADGGMVEGNVDNTAAFNAAVAQLGSGHQLYIPSGVEIEVRDTLTPIPHNADFWCEGSGQLFYDGPADRRVLQIGSETEIAERRHHRIKIRTFEGDWSNDNFVGVYIPNCRGSRIWLERSSGFSIGAKIIGKNLGVGNTRVHCGWLLDNRIGLDIGGYGSGGWMNSWSFYDGHFGGAAVPEDVHKYGVRVTVEAGAISCYNMEFHNPLLDVGESATHDRIGWLIDGGQVTAWGCHLESLQSIARIVFPQNGAGEIRKSTFFVGHGADALLNIQDLADSGSTFHTLHRKSRNLIDGQDLNMRDKTLTRAVLKDFAETVQAPLIVGGALAFNLENGNVGEVTLTANVTSMTIVNPASAGSASTFTVILRQDATGGRTVAWPAGVIWVGAEAPTMPTGANAVMVASFITTDAGASWLGFAK